MTYVAGRFVPTPHRSQYNADSPPRTRREGCTPTTGANGANASTGGRVDLTGAQVHALIPPEQETNPHVPGWSLVDLDRAMEKLVVSVPFERRSGRGWPAVVAALEAGLYVALQGDSDQFGNGTCSGVFDGDHCIGVDPATRTVNGQRQWWVNDPICPDGRWEDEATLRRYATKLTPSVLFGVFTNPVPRVVAAPHFAATVTTPTNLWNGATSHWVYNGRNNIKVGTRLVIRGAKYVKGGVSCYPIVGPAYAGYWVPVAHVKVGTKVP